MAELFSFECPRCLAFVMLSLGPRDERPTCSSCGAALRSLNPYLELSLETRELGLAFVNALGLPRLVGWLSRKFARG